jgi:hypothetical protein
MGGGHLIITIGALMLLITTVMSINRNLLANDEDISVAQADILAMSLTSSYLDRARGYSFDETVDTSSFNVTDPTTFTPAASLGPDSLGEDTLTTFNDIDDLDGYALEIQVRGSDEKYKSTFTVNYVTDANPDVVSSAQTFLKRVDVRTWRTFPPPPKSRPPDTLRAFVILSYDDLK